LDRIFPIERYCNKLRTMQEPTIMTVGALNFTAKN